MSPNGVVTTWRFRPALEVGSESLLRRHGRCRVWRESVGTERDARIGMTKAHLGSAKVTPEVSIAVVAAWQRAWTVRRSKPAALIRHSQATPSLSRSSERL